MSSVVFSIKVTPKSRENCIYKRDEHGILNIRVTAPPEDGKANEAVIKVLAQAFKISKSNISILRGLSSRQKVISIREWTDEQFHEAVTLYFSK